MPIDAATALILPPKARPASTPEPRAAAESPEQTRSDTTAHAGSPTVPCDSDPEPETAWAPMYYI